MTRPFTTSSILLLALAGCAHNTNVETAQRAGQPTPGHPIPLPARFLEHRIFVEPTTADGHTLRLYTDTGGGVQALYPDAVKKLGLPETTTEVPLGESRTESMPVVAIPAWREGAGIPPPLALDQAPLFRDHFVVVPPPFFAGPDEDGFLGEGWFGGRTWTFDYPGQKLLWRAEGDLPPHEPSHEIPIHFPRDASGAPTGSFGRITVEIDGQPVDLLFDTGATVPLTDEALQALGDGGGRIRGTSFIVESLFRRWHEKHPDWRVIEHAEAKTNFPMIEVPTVHVAVTTWARSGSPTASTAASTSS